MRRRPGARVAVGIISRPWNLFKAALPPPFCAGAPSLARPQDIKVSQAPAASVAPPVFFETARPNGLFKAPFLDHRVHTRHRRGPCCARSQHAFTRCIFSRTPETMSHIKSSGSRLEMCFLGKESRWENSNIFARSRVLVEGATCFTVGKVWIETQRGGPCSSCCRCTLKNRQVLYISGREMEGLDPPLETATTAGVSSLGAPLLAYLFAFTLVLGLIGGDGGGGFRADEAKNLRQGNSTRQQHTRLRTRTSTRHAGRAEGFFSREISEENVLSDYQDTMLLIGRRERWPASYHSHHSSLNTTITFLGEEVMPSFRVSPCHTHH